MHSAVRGLRLRWAMLARLDHTRLLRYAGLFTWAVVALPLVALWLRPIEPSLDLGEESASPVRIGAVAWSAYLGFGLIYGWLTRGLGSRRAVPVNSLLLLLLTGCAVATGLPHTGTDRLGTGSQR